MDKVFLDSMRDIELAYSPTERAGEVFQHKDLYKVHYTIHKGLRNKYIVERQVIYRTYISPFTGDNYDFNFISCPSFFKCITYIIKDRKEFKHDKGNR